MTAAIRILAVVFLALAGTACVDMGSSLTGPSPVSQVSAVGFSAAASADTPTR